MTVLRVTQKAARDIDEIFEYLANLAGRRTAEHHFLRLQTTIDRLLDWPESAQRRTEFGANIRLAVVAPYVVIYRYERVTEHLTVLRVLHERQNMTSDMIHPSDRS
jgi:toxin ParE1/3/4